MSRKVTVRFLPEGGGAPLGEVELDAEQLPESFEARTTLDLGGQTWEVVEAAPMTRAEYTKTRRLTIVLRQADVRPVAPKDILYSLPTINDALPAVAAGSSKLGKDVLELHEDDWRQIELVSRALAGVVEEQLGHVRRILEERTGPGFRAIHVRQQPASPLVEHHLTLDELARALPGARLLDGVAFRNAAGLIANGFALDGGGARVYGIAEDGVVTTCAFERAPAARLPQIAELADAHGLLLVDWCAARIVDS